MEGKTLHRRKGTLQAFSRSFRYRCIRTSGIWRRDLDWSELEQGEHRSSRFVGFSVIWSGVRSHGLVSWCLGCMDEWMGPQKASKDVFDGITDDVKDVK